MQLKLELISMEADNSRKDATIEQNESMIMAKSVALETKDLHHLRNESTAHQCKGILVIQTAGTWPCLSRVPFLIITAGVRTMLISIIQ